MKGLLIVHCDANGCVASSWTYPQSADFWDRKLSVDGSRPKVEFCGFFCLLLILYYYSNSVSLSHVHNIESIKQPWLSMSKL